MNNDERQRKLVPSCPRLTNSGTDYADSSIRLLGKDGKGIGVTRIVGYVTHFAGRLPRYDRSTERQEWQGQRWKLELFLYFHMLTIIVTSSYLTLGIFACDRAEPLWWPYTITAVILALTNLLIERSKHG